MALIKCPECGKEISNKAYACIHCGYPLDAHETAAQNEVDSEPEVPINDEELTFKADGYRIQKEYDKAFQLYLQLANRGDSSAQCWVAVFYERGWGVEKNAIMACEWYKKSSSAGYSIASTNLAGTYEHGVGVAQNLKEAIRYYDLAIAQDSTNDVALNNLAVMYMDGIGTSVNHERARALLKKAVGLGNKKALENFAELKKRIEVGDTAPRRRTAAPHNSSNTTGNSNANKKTILYIVAVVIAFIFLLSTCSGEFGDDSKCDIAGCGKSAICTFGDMEMCTSHYYEWSNKAYDYNHRND